MKNITFGIGAFLLVAIAFLVPQFVGAQTNGEFTEEDTPIVINLSNYADVSPDGVTFSVVDDVDNGSLSEINQVGEATYTPNQNFNGGDSFIFEVFQGSEPIRQPTSVYIYVNPVNDEPVITLNGDNPMSIFLGEEFIDPGAYVIDIEDFIEMGTTTISEAQEGSVDTDTIGTYLLTYTYTDFNDTSTSSIRTVNVVAREERPAPEPEPAPAPRPGGGRRHSVSSGEVLGASTTTVTTIQPAPIATVPLVGSVKIVWKTNIPATSQVVYGPTSEGPYKLDLNKTNKGYIYSTIEDKSKTTNHEVILKNITAGLSYSLRVVSKTSTATFGPEYRFALGADGQVKFEGEYGNKIIIGDANKDGETIHDFVKENDPKIKALFSN